MKTTIIIGLLATLVTAGAPLAAAECVEGAGSIVCVSDYSSEDSTYYMVDGQLADGTYVYGSFSKGQNWFGQGVLFTDGWIDSPTAGYGAYGYLFLSDGVPMDGQYENGDSYGEVYGYDGSYHYGGFGFSDRNGDGQPDADGAYYYASILP